MKMLSASMQDLCLGALAFLALIGSALSRCSAVNTRAWRPSVCAKVYQHNKCKGLGMTVFETGQHQDRYQELGRFNDLMSSIAVRPGCHLDVYEHTRFGGCSYRFGHADGHHQYMPWDYSISCRGSWNDAVSSVRCSCSKTRPVSPGPRWS